METDLRVNTGMRANSFWGERYSMLTVFLGERTSMFSSTQLESYDVQSLCDLVRKSESVKNGAQRGELAMETDLRLNTRMRASSFWGERYSMLTVFSGERTTMFSSTQR